jgi:ferredoxin/flavodoxin---NADP+ reductase
MKTVFVVGAGPAGLYASNKLAQAGHQVFILNRDIKPGGLAEYGIYPVKEKMKSGLRKQFAKILSLPNIHYFGHVPVGKGHAVDLTALRELSPQSLVCAVGAQGTKKLGLPGEELGGVYSAKDFVYHYNALPPFTSRDFSTGKRVAVMGMGNVMVDIARWLLVDDPEHRTEEVIVIARRGPLEAKFDQKEFGHIEMFLDVRAFHEELKRIQEGLAAAGQDIGKVADESFPILAKPVQEVTRPRLTFRFLCSPQSIHGDAQQHIEKLTLAENALIARDGGTSAKPTGQTSEINADTLIMAIGDVADPSFGLPYAKGEYITNPDATDPQRSAYEVFDPESGKIQEGTFVVGWARKASEGLVGVARFDAEQGATHVLKYMENCSDGSALVPSEIQRWLEREGLEVVTKEDLSYLGRAEEREAQKRGLPSFKFGDDSVMLSSIEQEKTHA